MSAFNFDELRRHVGHDVVVARYGDDKCTWNVSVECETCNEVLLGYDNPDLEENENAVEE